VGADRGQRPGGGGGCLWLVLVVGRGLVVVAGVQDQLAEQLAGVAVDHPDVSVVDEQADRGAGQPDAETDVVQPAVVAQSDGAPAVDFVLLEAVVGGDDRAGGDCLGTFLVGLQRSPPIQRPVRPDGVVVAGEAAELSLQTGHGVGWWLRGQPFLHRLVEALYLAAGLGMVGPRMADRDPQQAELHLQRDSASPRCLAVKTAPLSVNTLAGVPHRAKAVRKLATTSPPLVIRRASVARQSREWSSRMFKSPPRRRRPAPNG
jgi:hypothetical protein